MKRVYDESVTVSYPLYVCPVCGSKFYGGGKAIHNPGCSETGHDNCEVHYGPKQVEEVKKIARKYGPERSWYGINLNMLIEDGIELNSV